MKKAKLYKSKKTVSRHNKVSWRPRWAEIDSDGNSKVVEGKTQPTKNQADAYAQDMVNQINNRDKLNLVTESEIMTLGQFAEAVWIKAHRQKKVKNKAQIKTTMKFWKEIGLWETRLDEVTTAMCFKYIQILRDRGLVPTSIQNYKTELRTLLDLAIDYGQISSNVLNGVKSERRTNDEIAEANLQLFEDMRTNTWSLDEINTNLEKLRHIPRKKKTVTRLGTTYEQEWSSTGIVPEILWYGRFLIGFYLGLRSGEIMALKFSDFDHYNRQVLINKSIGRYSITDMNFNHEKYIEEEGKVKASANRYQDCQQKVLDFVLEVKDLQKDLGIYHEDQYIFADKNGKRVGLDYFRRQFSRIQELVGIERPLKSPKYTRHSSATILAGLGWSSKDIADHLGHKNDRVTREYYIQSQKENKRRMADEFGDGN